MAASSPEATMRSLLRCWALIASTARPVSFLASTCTCGRERLVSMSNEFMFLCLETDSLCDVKEA